MTAPAQGVAITVARVKQSALGSPGSTGSTAMRRVTFMPDYQRATYASNEIVADQQSRGAVAGIASVKASLAGELSAGTYAPEFSALLRQTFATVTPIASASLTIAGSGPTYTITRAAGSYLTDGVKIGDVIRLSVGGLSAANINKNLMVTAVTTTVLTVFVLNSVAMVAEGPIAGCTVTVFGKKAFVPLTGHNNDYLTYEKWFSDKSLSELYTDMKPGQAQISLPATGLATVSFDIPGLGRTRGVSQVLTSPGAPTTTNVLSAVNGDIIIGGAITPVTGANITISGNIQPGGAEVGSNNISDHQRGKVSVNGSFTAKFTTTTLQTLFDNQTPTTLALVVSDGQGATADFVTFVMTNIKIFSDAADDGEKEIIRTYNFTAAIDPAGGAALATNQTIITIQDSAA